MALGILRINGATTMTDELRQATEGDRRAMARLLSKIENGAVSLTDLGLDGVGSQSRLGHHGHHGRSWRR